MGGVPGKSKGKNRKEAKEREREGFFKDLLFLL